MTKLTPDLIEQLDEEAAALKATKDEMVQALGMAAETFDCFAYLWGIDFDRLIEIGFDGWMEEYELEMAEYYRVPVATIQEYRRRQEQFS